MERKSLGHILQEKKIVTNEQLEEALVEQLKSKRFLGDILIEKNYATKNQIFEALTQQKKADLVTLANVKSINPEIVKLIPENMARRYSALALTEEDDRLVVAMAEPTDIIAIDTLRRITEKTLRIVKAEPPELLAEYIDKYYSVQADLSETVAAMEDTDEDKQDVDVNQLRIAAEDAPIIKFVNSLFIEALEKRATDMHLEPQEKKVSIRFRVDGGLQQITPPPKSTYSGIVTRLKILSNLDIGERRLPQDGRTKIKLGAREFDIRISTLPTIYGEKVVMRLLDRKALLKPLNSMGFDEQEEGLFKEAIKKPYGMIVVTGPTGSGKTTTLYSGLNFINTPEKNIITVEDPVEYELEGINQVQVRPRIGFNFASALRTFLRQDPDVIMVGEIRDLETAQIAIQASLTGHLVISTLHTNDTVSTIQRLDYMGVPHYLLAESLVMIIAQRLVKRICEDCKTEDPEGMEILSKMGIDIPGTPIYRGRGCAECNYTGYYGRIAVFEILNMTREIRRAILNRSSEEEIKKISLGQGMKSLRDATLEKVLEGVTTAEEFISKTMI